MVRVELTVDERDDLASLLDAALRDMGSEIADTDNAGYRAGLEARRDRLRSVAERVSALQGTDPL